MKNIFQLYIENGCKYGFNVHRSSWASDKKAKLVKIEGVVDGQMINGKPPYFSMPYPKGHPKEGKTCWNREVTLEADWVDGGIYKTNCGGNYSWEKVD